MYSKSAARASDRVAKSAPWTNSFLSDAKKMDRSGVVMNDGWPRTDEGTRDSRQPGSALRQFLQGRFKTALISIDRREAASQIASSSSRILQETRNLPGCFGQHV